MAEPDPEAILGKAFEDVTRHAVAHGKLMGLIDVYGLVQKSISSVMDTEARLGPELVAALEALGVSLDHVSSASNTLAVLLDVDLNPPKEDPS